MTTGKAITGLLAMLLSTPVAAQTLVSPEVFLDRAEGRTLTFNSLATGRLVGEEQFLSRTESIWKTPSRGCVHGQITIDRGRLCFLYPEIDPYRDCWWIYDHDGTMIVRPVGEFTRGTQIIDNIRTTPLSCEMVPMS